MATVLAPKIGRRGKVSVTLNYVTRIRERNHPAAVSVTYAVNGENIDDDIYISEIGIRNCGPKDVTLAAFQNPISIKFPENTRILSADCVADTPCDSTIAIYDNKLEASWDILKRKEILSISCLFTTDSATVVKSKDVQTACRLIDVDLVDELTSRLVATIFASATVFLIGLGIVSGIYSESDLGVSNALTIVNEEPVPILVSSNFTSVSACEAKSTIWSIRNCTESSLVEANVSQLTPQRTPVGIRLRDLIGILVLIGLYSLPIGTAIAGIGAKKRKRKFLAFSAMEKMLIR